MLSIVDLVVFVLMVAGFLLARIAWPKKKDKEFPGNIRERMLFHGVMMVIALFLLIFYRTWK